MPHTPVGYITYKGHFLFADDPKVKEHSDPEPVYSGPPDFREMREMLRAMQAGELTVSRGIEILNMWYDGEWNDNMLPPVRQDLIEEDSMPVDIIDRLKTELESAQRVISLYERLDSPIGNNLTDVQRKFIFDNEYELKYLPVYANQPDPTYIVKWVFEIRDKHGASVGGAHEWLYTSIDNAMVAHNGLYE